MQGDKQIGTQTQNTKPYVYVYGERREKQSVGSSFAGGAGAFASPA